MNLFMLFAFTATMSYTIGIVCTAYASLGLMVVVVEAFAITSLVFIGMRPAPLVDAISTQIARTCAHTHMRCRAHASP